MSRAVRGLRRVAAGVGGRGPPGRPPGALAGPPGRGPGRGPPAGPTGPDRPPRPAAAGGRRPAGSGRPPPAACGTAAGRGRGGPFPVLLAAFAALLGRYAGTPDVVASACTRGRPRPARTRRRGGAVCQPAAGPPSTWPGRPHVRRPRRPPPATPSSTPSLRPPGPAVRASSSRTPPARTTPRHRHPLFNVLSSRCRTRSPPRPRPARLADGHPFGEDVGTAKFDLCVDIAESEGELRVTLEYAADLFDHATAERMLGHYLTLARSSGRAPGCSR